MLSFITRRRRWALMTSASYAYCAAPWLWTGWKT
jgi:hypothetical protein